MIEAASLLEGLEGAVTGAANAERRTLASATAPIDPGVDPSALAFGSRLAGDRWFCWEQPDRDFALAGIVSTLHVVSRGEDRFTDTARRCS